MNVVFIVPTGIGAEIGGHSGDATPSAKLVASVCDKLFIHPNIVNASDINEMTENMLYVEGSILDRFLEGHIGLEEVYGNKILVAVNKPVSPEIINAVSGARATIGADIEIVELKKTLKMIPTMEDHKASGEIENLDEAVEQVRNYKFDVLVVNTAIDSDKEKALEYLSSEGGTNLWGGVEARLSEYMSMKLNRPVIHSPVENSDLFRTFNQAVDPRKAAEMVSICYLHCCLKGAHKAPKISMRDEDYWNTDIDFMVTPAHVFGRPHLACIKAGIQVIEVEENKTSINTITHGGFIKVRNYLEVVGIIGAKKAGITLESVSRPLTKTKVHYHFDEGKT